MINIIQLLIFGFFNVSIADAATPFVADCWALASEVKAIYQNQGGVPFRKYCEKTFDGTVIQSGRRGFVCIAPTYKFIHSDMPGEASHCPAMRPVEQRRWYFRCKQAASNDWTLGWEIGNRVSETDPRFENIRCQ